MAPRRRPQLHHPAEPSYIHSPMFLRMTAGKSE
jgi:hypothetical protein